VGHVDEDAELVHEGHCFPALFGQSEGLALGKAAKGPERAAVEIEASGGRVRVLHHESFRDDPTRIFRAARFAGRFGWELDKETRMWLKEAVKEGVPALLSRERLRNELLKLLEEKDPAAAFAVLEKFDSLKFFHRYLPTKCL